MTTRRIAIGVLAVMQIFLSAAVVRAEDSGSTKSGDLRVEWQLQSTRGKYRNYCGRVYNDRPVPARTVILLFEGLDGSGQTVSRRSCEVIGGVQASSSSIFCLLVPAEGTTYRVSVPTVDWGGFGQ